MHDVLGNAALRSDARNPVERALLARLELSSFMRAAPWLYSLGDPKRATGCRAWWFAHRAWGLDIGMIEGACVAGVADVEHELDPSTWAQNLLLDSTARVIKVTSLRTPGVQQRTDATGESGTRDRKGLFATTITSSFRDLLSLSGTYEETLADLGRHTRRNIRSVQKTAASLGISFSLVPREWHVPYRDIRELAARTRPSPHPPGRIRKYERYVARTGGGFRSCLRDPGGTLISYCCGFMHEKTAYLIYQLNDADWHSLSPSLLHRAHLIEVLTATGVRDLIFVHGCRGVLQHACHPMSIDQTWFMRSDQSSRLLTKFVAAMTPVSGYRQLALQALRQSATTLENARR